MIACNCGKFCRAERDRHRQLTDITAGTLGEMNDAIAFASERLAAAVKLHMFQPAVTMPKGAAN